MQPPKPEAVKDPGGVIVEIVAVPDTGVIGAVGAIVDALAIIVPTPFAIARENPAAPVCVHGPDSSGTHEG